MNKILIAVASTIIAVSSFAVVASADSTYVNNTVDGKAACLAGNCFVDASPTPTTAGPCTPGALVVVGGMVTYCPGATTTVATTTTAAPATTTTTTTTTTEYVAPTTTVAVTTTTEYDKNAERDRLRALEDEEEDREDERKKDRKRDRKRDRRRDR